MTASERLKALDDAALYVTNVQTTDTRAYALAILRDVRDALPEIIALVEAAEQLPEFVYAEGGVAHSFVPLLAVLNEKLERT